MNKEQIDKNNIIRIKILEKLYDNLESRAQENIKSLSEYFDEDARIVEINLNFLFDKMLIEGKKCFRGLIGITISSSGMTFIEEFKQIVYSDEKSETKLEKLKSWGSRNAEWLVPSAIALAQIFIK